MRKKEKWIKKRHSVVRNIVCFFLKPYIKYVYGAEVEKFKEQGDRQYLVLYNHQTPFDQFFVGIAFSKPVYYVASEDIFSKGWVSSLIRWLVAPIPIKKQTADVQAIRDCLQVASEGGTISIAPEGNRTYSGKTEYVNPTIGYLAKRLKLPVALFKIEGGYGVQPRWSDVIRKGKMNAYVSEVIEPEELASMSADEASERITKGLFVSDAKDNGVFKHKKRGEYLERAIYVCPFCGLSEFESNFEKIKCKKCSKTVIYGENTSLSGEGFEFPFKFVNDWYEYQQDYVNAIDINDYQDTPMYRDSAEVSEVIIRKTKKLMHKNAEISLYGNRIQVNDTVFSFADTAAVTVLGRNKVNIYYNKKVYQLKGSKRFNGIKYVNIFHRFKNIEKGDGDGKFLGL